LLIQFFIQINFVILTGDFLKLKNIEIKNFRSIKHETIDCAKFNSFVGPNGSGKSTVLNALNLFFGEINSFSEDDFHNREISAPIVVKIEFDELSTEAAEEFSHYVRAGLLVVQAEVAAATQEGSFKKVVRGERLVFESFREYFDAKTAKERGEIFTRLRENYEGIGNASNEENRRAALTKYEEALPESDKKLALSGAEFFGVSKGVDKFQRHISWVYVPAVKDASSESEEAKTSHLGKLIQHTIRSGMDYEVELDRIRTEALESYSKLLTNQRTHLTELQKRLASRLQAAVMTEADLQLDWKKDEKSVSVQDPVAQVLLSDRGFVGEVERFGHGLQRSFLLVILQELMAVDSTVSPTLILGCEEPELYQHPPQARHLAEILMELSAGDAQVLITTHSPYFVDVEHFDGIKMFRNVSGSVSISKSSFLSILNDYNAAFDKVLHNEDQARTKLAIQIQPKFNEIFFAEKVILVEGISDLACLEAYLRLSGKRSKFQKSGASIVVCEGKSSLALMLLIAKSFSIPFHVIFDCDSGYEAKYQENTEKYRQACNEHIRDNDAILELAGHAKLGQFPGGHIFKGNLTAWHIDIENMLEQEFGASSVGFHQAGRNAVGNLRNSKKHPLYVSASMSSAWDSGRKFPVLEKVVNALLV